MKPILSALLLLPLATTARAAPAIIRHNVATFPIAASIEVPPGYSTIYLSGTGADPADKTAKSMTLAAYGDTETQTRSALAKIGATLASLHLGFGDVVQMHVYLVADPKLGKLDFAGMMKAYKDCFGTAAQPNLPTRSAVQVAALPHALHGSGSGGAAPSGVQGQSPLALPCLHGLSTAHHDRHIAELAQARALQG